MTGCRLLEHELNFVTANATLMEAVTPCTGLRAKHDLAVRVAPCFRTGPAQCLQQVVYRGARGYRAAKGCRAAGNREASSALDEDMGVTPSRADIELSET